MSRHRLIVRSGAVSMRLDVRMLSVLALLGAATLAVFTLSIGQGEFPIPASDVLTTLLGAGDRATHFVVFDLRLPRALTAVLVGTALGIAGAIFQDIARNGLVSPDIVGIARGASLAAVAVIVLVGTSSAVSVPIAALGGALLAGVLLYALSWRGGLHGYRLVLVGIGLDALLTAGIDYVLTRGRLFEVAQATVWLVGSLNGRGWEHVWPLLATMAVLVPLAFVLARQIEVLQLDDDVARALGVSVERARLALVTVAIVLTAVAVSAAGPIAFAAFMAPHIARRIGRSVAPANVLPIAAMTGALLVLSADLIGRVVFPTDIPVGIVTSVVAAPYLLFLLHRANRIGTSG